MTFVLADNDNTQLFVQEGNKFVLSDVRNWTLRDMCGKPAGREEGFYVAEVVYEGIKHVAFENIHGERGDIIIYTQNGKQLAMWALEGSVYSGEVEDNYLKATASNEGLVDEPIYFSLDNGSVFEKVGE